MHYYSLCRDRVPTVLVKEWPLLTNMFDGDQIMGPVPTLFAENIEVKSLIISI
jgi:hypothetical protein